MDMFLNAKHWQIFLITFGLPLILEILSIPYMILGNNSLIIMKVMPFLMVVSMVGFFGWLWAIGVNLQQALPDELKLNTGKFKVFLFLPVLYILIFFVFMHSVMVGAMESGRGIGSPPFALIFPMHLFAMFCIIYCLYFAARVFKSAELQRKVTFSEFAGEFFLIWFFPVGVWIIQPKINQMMEKKDK
jgi:hypothetical protein